MAHTIKEDTINRICTVISRHTGADIDLFLNRTSVRTRRREVVVSRQLLAYFLSFYTKLTVYEIGKIIKQEHSTVSSSKKAISNSYDIDYDPLKMEKGFRETVDEMKRKVLVILNDTENTCKKEEMKDTFEFHENVAKKARLEYLNKDGYRRGYTIDRVTSSHEELIHLTIGLYNDLDATMGEFSIVQNSKAEFPVIKSYYNSFKAFPYFHDLFHEIAEGAGRITEEILCLTLENLHILDMTEYSKNADYENSLHVTEMNARMLHQ